MQFYAILCLVFVLLQVAPTCYSKGVLVSYVAPNGQKVNTTLSPSSPSISFKTPGNYSVSFNDSAQVLVKMWGAGGAAGPVGTELDDNNGYGGGGGYSNGIISVIANTVYWALVGEGGVHYAGNVRNGGGGGTASALLFRDLDIIMIAGGGGGGSTRAGGAGGGAIGQSGAARQGAYGVGTGGSQSAAGRGGKSSRLHNSKGNGQDGIATIGGNGGTKEGYGPRATKGYGIAGGGGDDSGDYGGGGGGAGFFGGGGGAADQHGGTGGGGSGYVNTTALVNAQTTTGDYRHPGNYHDSDRDRAGEGATANNGSGSNGLIYFSINIGGSPPQQSLYCCKYPDPVGNLCASHSRQCFTCGGVHPEVVPITSCNNCLT